MLRSVIALSLLASVASAYAERAWVLWSNVYVMKKGRVLDQFYSADEAFTNKPECDKSTAYYREKYRDPARKAYFTCLPDTVDPREPKAK